MDVAHYQLITGDVISVTPATPLPVVTVPSVTIGPTSEGYQQIVGLVASTALTIPGGSTSVMLITTEGQSVRWRDDGVAPTAAIGQLLLVGQVLIYDSLSFAALRFIQTAATATLNASYYR